MKNIDKNPVSNTSKEAPVHSKDTVLLCNDYKGSDKDEMLIPSAKWKNVSGGRGVLVNHKIRM